MKKLLALALILILAFGLVACGNGGSNDSGLVGTWEVTEDWSWEWVIVFNADGTGYEDGWPIRWSAENGYLTIYENDFDDVLEYSIDGNVLTLQGITFIRR